MWLLVAFDALQSLPASWLAENFQVLFYFLIIGTALVALVFAIRSVVGRTRNEELQRVQRERDDALAMLSDSEHRFQKLCDHIAVGIFVRDARGDLIYRNSRCAEIAGVDESQLPPHDWQQSPSRLPISEPGMNVSRNAQDEIMAFRFCHRFVQPDGCERWADVTTVPVDDSTGNVLSYIGTLVDVTEQRLAADAQHASESRYQAIVHEQSDLIVRWKADGTLLFANEAWCRFQGCRLEDALGIDFLSVVPEQRRDDLRNWASNVTLEHPVTTGESHFETADGQHHIQLWTEHGIFDESGNLIEIQSVGRDITAEREAEEQYREQQRLLAHVSRLSTMGELIAGIAHEVNQPLYSIKNCAQALQNVLADGEAGDRELLVKCADQIGDASSRAGQMIRRLRNFTRQGDSDRTSCRLSAVIDEAIRLVAFEARRHRASVSLQVDEPGIEVHVDRVQIQQVMVNLLKNSFESMSVSVCDERKVVVRCVRDGDFGRVSVIDSGAGVSSELQDGIFDAFVTTRSDGMGMGLAISRTIIDSHGGRIWLEQTQSGGATFHFELPLSETAAQDKSPALEEIDTGPVGVRQDSVADVAAQEA